MPPTVPSINKQSLNLPDFSPFPKPMSHKLQTLLGALKDKTILITTSPTSPSPSPSIAVLRATPHHPSTHPPPPHHLSTLLSFGLSSRLSATSLVRSLLSRLSSASDPSVALKSLLSLHHLLSHGSFILVDSVISSLLPSSGRRSPLNLSSFKSPTSLPLSSFVRWYARLLELLVILTRSAVNDHQADRLTALPNKDLIAELEMLVEVVEEMDRAPDTLMHGENMLVMEIMRMAGEEMMKVEEGVGVRVQELKERVNGETEFGECVELVCLFRRLEESSCGGRWEKEVGEVRERIGEAVERREKERLAGRVQRRERVSESARMGVDRVEVCGENVKFGSTRWVKS